MGAMPGELRMPNGLRVFVGDLGGLPEDLAARLEQQGFAVEGVAGAGRIVAAVRARTAVDAVLLFAPRIDAAALRIVEQLASEPGKPLAMFCEDAERAAMQRAVAAGVNAYAVTGITASRMQAAINLALVNHSCTHGLKEELDEAKQALRERRIIERAKGIVMVRRGLDEAGAYKFLRSRAMQRGMRIAALAQQLAEADDLLG